jgi:hypothetical protein
MRITTGSIAHSFVCLVTAAASLSAQGADSRPPDMSRRIDGDYYAAGNRIDIPAPVDGDVVIAGRVLRVAGPVRGDVLAAGWRVTIADHVMDDVRAAGGEVLIDAPIDGDLILAGGDVTLGSESHVTGRAWLSGGTVRVEGQIDRVARIAAGNVQLAGEFREPLHVIGEELHVLPGARILGPLTYEGPAPLNLSPEATVNGPIAYRKIGAAEARRARWPKAASSVLFAAHLFLAGFLLLILFPRLTTAAPETLRARPGQSLLVGFVLLVTLPVVALLFLISVLGIPVGVSLAAGYVVALFLGLLTTAFYVGDIEAGLLRQPLTTTARRIAFLLAGVATLSVLRSFPFVGGWFVFLSVVFGLGALAIWLCRTYTGTTAEPLLHRA